MQRQIPNLYREILSRDFLVVDLLSSDLLNRFQEGKQREQKERDKEVHKHHQEGDSLLRYCDIFRAKDIDYI